MKRMVLTAAILALSAGIASAAQPGGKYNSNARHVTKHQAVKHHKSKPFVFKHRAGRVTSQERRAIARSQFRLAALKRRVWADGRVSFFERKRLQIAKSRHQALVRRARRS